ncbi:hypothetical protein F4604DRAFT_1809184, partial [Suillus subluteus]
MLDMYHWTVYFLVTVMYPRFLITPSEIIESKPISVFFFKKNPIYVHVGYSTLCRTILTSNGGHLCPPPHLRFRKCPDGGLASISPPFLPAVLDAQTFQSAGPLLYSSW